MRTWLKVTAFLPEAPDDWSIWAEVFRRHGLPGTVQTDSPLTMSAYLAPGDESDLSALQKSLQERGAKVETEEVEEEDWSETWKQFFKPIPIGDKFFIRPSWEECDVPDGRHEIVLDPGQAFGTGDHPTTRMCLMLLERTDLVGKRVADIGCGSGILSIAAGQLGAKSIDAVDSDHLSVESTLENAARNGVTVNAYGGLGFAPLGEETYEVAISNIISAAVINLAPDAASHVTDGGTWIVSGIIEANWPEVEKAVTRAGFTVEDRILEGDWVAATLHR